MYYTFYAYNYRFFAFCKKNGYSSEYPFSYSSLNLFLRQIYSEVGTLTRWIHTAQEQYLFR